MMIATWRSTRRGIAAAAVTGLALVGLTTAARAREYPLARGARVSCKSNIAVFRGGKISRCEPWGTGSYPIVGQQVVCRARLLRFFGHGLLRACMLDGGQRFPLAGGGKAACAPDLVELHPGGTLRLCTPDGDQRLKAGKQVVSCLGRRAITIHPNGSLESCFIRGGGSFAAARGKRACQAGRQARFDPAGRLTGC